MNGVTYIVSARWDGSHWTVVPMPQPIAGAYVSDIAVNGPNDVYVCGYQADATQFLFLHWNGVAWSPVQLPTAANDLYRQLWTVESLGSNNV